MRGRLLHHREEAREARGEAPRRASRSPSRSSRTLRASGVSTTLGRGRGGGGPDGLAVIADSCMAADAAAAGVQALLPKEFGFAQARALPQGRAGGARWRVRRGGADRGRRRRGDRRVRRRSRRSAKLAEAEAPGRGAPRARQPPHVPLPRPGRPRGLRRRVRRADRRAPRARERVPGADHAGLADAARRRRAGRALPARRRTVRRCSRSTTRSPRRSCRRGARASSVGWSARRPRSCAS